MLNKKSIKVISIVILAIVLLMSIGSTVFAATTIPGITDPQTGELNNTVGIILGIIRWGGIIIAVIMAMFIGIKYITSSPDGKAEVKKTAMYYVGGIVLLLAASTIVTFIGNTIKPNSITEGKNESVPSIVTSINA